MRALEKEGRRMLRKVVTLNFTSWNQITDWLRRMDSVKQAA